MFDQKILNPFISYPQNPYQQFPQTQYPQQLPLGATGTAATIQGWNGNLGPNDMPLGMGNIPIDRMQTGLPIAFNGLFGSVPQGYGAMGNINSQMMQQQQQQNPNSPGFGAQDPQQQNMNPRDVYKNQIAALYNPIVADRTQYAIGSPERQNYREYLHGMQAQRHDLEQQYNKNPSAQVPTSVAAYDPNQVYNFVRTR